MQAAPSLDEQVEGAAHGGVAGDAAGAVRAAADRADDEFVEAPSAPSAIASSSAQPLARPRRGPAAIDARVPPVAWMTSVCTGRPDARTARSRPYLVEALAAERDEQHGADVGMRAQRAPSSAAA